MAGEDAHAASAAALSPNRIPASEKRSVTGTLPGRGAFRSEQQRCGSKPDRFRHHGGANLDRERRRGTLAIANSGATRQRAEALGRARKRILVWVRQRICPGKRTTALDRSASPCESVASGSAAAARGRRRLPRGTGGAYKASRTDSSGAFPRLRGQRCAGLCCAGRFRLSLGVRGVGYGPTVSNGGGLAFHFD